MTGKRGRVGEEKVGGGGGGLTYRGIKSQRVTFFVERYKVTSQTFSPIASAVFCPATVSLSLQK